MSPVAGRSSPEDEDDQTFFERPSPTLVSLHFIRTALRRRLAVCVLSVIAGLLGAGLFMVAFPPAHAAKTSLVLTYDAQSDSARAMATNVSLLKTRTLGTKVITTLGLAETPEDFFSTVTIEPAGSELLSLTLTAPTDAEAVRRLDALTSIYLEYRADQLSFQSQVIVDGLQARIDKLQQDVEDLSKQIEQLTAAGIPSSSKLSDAISQRGSLQGRIETLQQSLEDATLRNSAVVASSRVLDPPAAEPGRAKRTVVIGLASGLLGGAALGCGLVLFVAITSDRLRRRADVRSVLGVAVPISVGRIAPVYRGWRWLPHLHGIDGRRSDERLRLAHAIEQELLAPDRASTLAIACIDNAPEVSFAVTTAALRLGADGRSVTIIDLVERGSKGLQVGPAPSGSEPPTVLRPRGLPALAHRGADLLTDGDWADSETTTTPEPSDITLILADLDPTIGAAHLTAWTERVVVVVTAGRSSVEKVRSVGDQIRAAGLELRFAALLRTERADESSGAIVVERASSPQPKQQERPGLAERAEAR